MTGLFQFFNAALFIILVGQPTHAQEIKLGPDQFVKEVLKQNLDIRLAAAETQEVKARAEGIRIPPPAISVSQMNMNDGGKSNGWSVSQTIPFPSKISSEYSARQHAVHAQKDEEVVTHQEIRAQAKLVYFQIWEAQEQGAILKEKRKLLSEHLLIARSMAQSDTFAKIHLLKVESERDKLDIELNSITQIQRERLSLAAKLLDKDPASFKLIVVNPGLSDQPDISSVDETPQIQSMIKHVKHYQSLEKASRTEWLPDFTLTYSHMDETQRFPENNQIMVGVTLPFLYFWQPSVKSAEGSVQRMETEIKLSKMRRNIQAEKINLESEVKTLRSKISILNEKVLPRAVRQKKLLQNVAPRDLSSLQEHLDTYLSIPNIRLEILSLQSQYEQVVAYLSKYATQRSSQIE